MKRNWISDYGNVGVLLALCGLFMVLTWGEQRPSGVAAARQLASAWKTPKQIVIVAPPTNDGEIFTKELETLAANDKIEVVKTVRGEPHEVRGEIEALLDAKASFDTYTVHPQVYHWTVFDELVKKHASLKEIEIVTPASGHGSSFLRPQNLLNIANQIAVIAIIAIGMTMVIITGGIDLSVGSLLALSAVGTTWLIREYGGGKEASVGAMMLASTASIALCGAIGSFNGIMVTRFRVPAFIVTLSVMLMVSGLAYRWSDRQSIDAVPTSFTWLGSEATIPLLPNAVVLMLVLYFVAHVVMTRTVLGRHIYAVGGNAKAAWLSAVPVNRVLVTVYAVCGALAGLGGVVLASQLKSGAPTYGEKYEMFVIAAVVVGGTSLTGGEGNISGTLIGALIIAVIQNGMNLIGIDGDMQLVVLGGLILGAVLIDQLRKSRG